MDTTGGKRTCPLYFTTFYRTVNHGFYAKILSIFSRGTRRPLYYLYFQRLTWTPLPSPSELLYFETTPLPPPLGYLTHQSSPKAEARSVCTIRYTNTYVN